MKRLLFILILAVTFTSYGQVPPEAFNYSAVARDATGQPISSTTIGIRVTILQSSTTGTPVYEENHFVDTDEFGMFDLVIGTGAVQNGSISTIEWHVDDFYLEIGMDISGGTNFLNMGITQLLSVPYALHAKTASNVIGGTGGGFVHYIGEEFGGGIVFHLWKDSNGIEHGLIVSKSETASEWQTIATLVNADRSWDGVYNTSLMTNSPAADYVNNLSEGGFTDWYLPSMDEMIKLFSNRFEINQVLFAGGFTLLGSYYNPNYFQYWTSNEDQETQGVTVDIYNGTPSNDDKTTTQLVRAIRKF